MLGARMDADRRRRRSRTSITALGAVGALVSSVLLAAPAAHAFSANQTTVVNAVPAANTPDVNNGVVFSIAHVGADIVLGGKFTSVSPADDLTKKYTVHNTVAFNAHTGAINTGFVPVINGRINTVAPGPAPNEVYIGGTFTFVDGVAMRIALLNTTTGAIASGWHPSAMDRPVDKIELSHGRLYVGGVFTVVGGKTHRGLVTLNPRTGTVTPYVNLVFTGHHSYGRLCNPAKARCASARTGLKGFDINPAGTRLIAIGDFTNVSGVARDQIALITLGKPHATVDTHWNTLAYTAGCIEASFDSYIRDVQFSPTGSYFVVVDTGGVGTNSDGTNSSCDSAARFNTSATGTNLRPAWIDYTGEDSLWSVAVTGAAIYIGGHQRWLNNSFGRNQAGPGAVARPGISALSPASGLPLLWNPGRNPRGAGCYALLATAHGLWIGSDTNYIGDGTYLRERVAYFPLAGGQSLPSVATPRLPGRVFLAGTASSTTGDPNRLVYREFDGTTVGSEIPLSTGLPWGSVNGAFTVGGEVYYGRSDGNLYERSFDGSTFGPEVELDPYNDPTWDNVQTGSGQTYQGQPSGFVAQIPSVTSMFFTNGRLYYTLAGKPQMHWRWFEPESGVVGADQFTVAGTMDWSTVAGAFLAGSRLYYADAISGELRSVAWSDDEPTGASTLVSSATDWASRGLFALSGSTNPTTTPVAAFSGSCNTAATCSFSATPWVDPDGGVSKYSWNFGDGTTAPPSTSPKVSHRFTTDGAQSVTLTVTVTSGTNASVTHTVSVAAPIEKIQFVAASSGSGTGRTAHVVVPRKVAAGNAMVLFDSFASTKARQRPLKGWHLVGRTRRRSLTTLVYARVAKRGAGGRRASVSYTRSVHSSLILDVYSHTSSRPIEARAVAYGVATAVHRSPRLRGVTAGSWLVGYWTQQSGLTTSWTPPRGLRRRGAAHSSPRPADGAIVADAGKACSGTCQLGVARTKHKSRAAVQWVIALRPALA